MEIKILLADDHNIMRKGLRSLLEKKEDFAVIAEAENGRTTVKLTKELEPDVVIMDISMPDLNGIDATRQIIDSSPDIKIIALSMYSDRKFVAGMLKAGASGYLLKDCAFDELCKAIRAVHENKTNLSPGVGVVIAKDFLNHLLEGDLKKYTSIGKQEMEVLLFFANGKTPKQIASKLSIDIDCIENVQQKIINKWMLTC